MSILLGIASIVAIIFMVVSMVIGIWLLIVACKAYQQLRYKNYILEKINGKLDLSPKLTDSGEHISSKETEFLLDLDTTLTHSTITDFDKLDKHN